MTYEEYKSSNKKSSSFIKIVLNKLFTIVIFTMIIMTLCNYSDKFKSFVVNDVLNSTMDFSLINRVVNNFTNVFKNEKTKNVSLTFDNKRGEQYLDGVKYKTEDNEDVFVKESGIVTFIGNKEGYNNTVIVQQSNGYYAWYGNIKESVKLYDYIEKGNVIGKSSNEWYYALFKDDKKVDISES